MVDILVQTFTSPLKFGLSNLLFCSNKLKKPSNSKGKLLNDVDWRDHRSITTHTNHRIIAFYHISIESFITFLGSKYGPHDVLDYQNIMVFLWGKVYPIAAKYVLYLFIKTLWNLTCDCLLKRFQIKPTKINHKSTKLQIDCHNKP